MIKIWDNHNKQWLEPMSIFFGKDNSIRRVTACKPNEDPLSDERYDLQGKDLDEIAIIGDLNMNEELAPEPYDEKSGFIERLKENIRNAKSEEEKIYYRAVANELFFDWKDTEE